MTKEEFVRKVAKQTRLPMSSRRRCECQPPAAGGAVAQQGEKVTFPGFGTFETRKRKGGKVKHIRTGKVVEYKGRTVAAFRPGAYLKNAAAGKRRR